MTAFVDSTLYQRTLPGAAGGTFNFYLYNADWCHDRWIICGRNNDLYRCVFWWSYDAVSWHFVDFTDQVASKVYLRNAVYCNGKYWFLGYYNQIYSSVDLETFVIAHTHDANNTMDRLFTDGETKLYAKSIGYSHHVRSEDGGETWSRHTYGVSSVYVSYAGGYSPLWDRFYAFSRQALYYSAQDSAYVNISGPSMPLGNWDGSRSVWVPVHNRLIYSLTSADLNVIKDPTASDYTLSTPPILANYASMAASDTGEVVLINTGGTAIRSTDGGDTWENLGLKVAAANGAFAYHAGIWVLADRSGSVYTSASFKISGIVRSKSGAVAGRTVRIYNRSTGQLVNTVTSDPGTGYYEAYVGDNRVQYDRVVLTDDAAEGAIYNDLIDRVQPV